MFRGYCDSTPSWADNRVQDRSENIHQHALLSPFSLLYHANRAVYVRLTTCTGKRSVPPGHERERELGVLRDPLATALAGRGRLALIGEEVGIGA